MKSILIAGAIFLSSINSDASCGNAKKAVFFANGMFNDRAAAYNSLNYLKKEHSKKHPDLKKVEYELAFNTDEPMLLQLFQIYRQMVTESDLSFWKSIGLILTKMDNQEHREFIRKHLSEEKLRDHDLRVQIQRYKKLIQDGFDIVTVAHSQGNLYTLFSFEDLESSATQMVSVATPTGYVYGDGPYFTFKSDGVIKYIPTALPPNIRKADAAAFDHEFVKHYMGDSKAHEEILEALDIAMQNRGTSSEKSLNPAVGYFNSDMTKNLEWFDAYLKSKRKLSIGECILVESLFSVYALHGRECERRDLATFLEGVQDCAKRENEEGGGETACPYYRGMDLGNPYKEFYPSEKWEHYKLNPHCEMTYEDFRKVRAKGTDEALSALNSR
ncbi:hypothetical protein D3C87_1081640 [compost metagenome]